MTDSIATRMSRVMAEVGPLAHDKKNAHFNYGYTSAAAVQARVQAACAKHEVAVSIDFLPVGDVSGTDATLRCEVTWTCGDGSTTLRSVGYGSGKDKADKAVAKAQTMALKYALTSGTLTGTGIDPEETAHDAAGDPDMAKAMVLEAKRREDDLTHAAELRDTLETLGSKKDFETWCHMNAGDLATLHQTAKGRLWTVIRKTGSQWGMSDAEIKMAINGEVPV